MENAHQTWITLDDYRGTTPMTSETQELFAPKLEQLRRLALKDQLHDSLITSVDHSKNHSQCRY